MTDPKVIEYIKSETAKGVSRDVIMKNLIQVGGWTLADTQAHFSLAEQNQGPIATNPIQNNQSNKIKNMQMQQKKRMNVFGVNLLIFASYYVLGVLSAKILGYESFSFTFIYVYIPHALLLILISIIKGIRGMLQKVKTNAGQYFLTAILLLIIGFGACTFAFTSGIMDINI